MNFKEDEIVLCTVKKIEGTTVFLETDDKFPGTMSFSEVSPGRIRNIREFVIVGKKIVCKILRAKEDHLELSLRRVTGTERDEVLEKEKKEKILKSILKPVLKDKLESIMLKITEKQSASEFFDILKRNPSTIQDFVTKSEAEQIESLFAEKQNKDKIVKKKITAKSMSSSGVKELRELLSTKDAEVAYLGSSQFSISVKAKEFKVANTKMDELLHTLKEKAKKHDIAFEIK